MHECSAMGSPLQTIGSFWGGVWHASIRCTSPELSLPCFSSCLDGFPTSAPAPSALRSSQISSWSRLGGLAEVLTLRDGRSAPNGQHTCCFLCCSFLRSIGEPRTLG